MPFVMTVDQRASRAALDRVAPAIDELAGLGRLTTLRPFERTAGDEFQGVLDDPVSVVTAMLHLMADQHWHLGLGVGVVEEPMPPSARAGRGPAYLDARTAVDDAKHADAHLAVRSTPAPDDAAELQAVLRLLQETFDRRTAPGWVAVRLAAEGVTQSESGRRLGVSTQAVSQRLATAGWAAEAGLRAVLPRMVGRLHDLSTGDHGRSA